MKKWSMWAVVAVAATMMLTQSCTKDECTREQVYMTQVPIWRTLAQIRQDIAVEAGKELDRPGKIYVYGNYLFVNELYRGVHIIDNTNPESPTPVAFINIPGNVDMAVENGILYADNYIDLIAIDITTPTAPTVVKRVESVFEPQWTDPNQGLLVGYEMQEVKEVVPCNSWRGGGWWGGTLFLERTFALSSLSDNSNAGNQSGVGGSMARFTISKGFLYTVDNTDLRVFDLSTPADPTFEKEVMVGWGIETIFPYEDQLFIGSSNGMFIFDNTEPTSPYQLAQFAHVSACDPVFVKDNYAYVTLRSGTFCQGFTNQLDLIDISEIGNPVLAETFPMDNPHGLSINNNELYLCEGEHGLKVFDVTDPLKLDKNQLKQFKDRHAYDVITLGNRNLAIMIGEDGLYQYDITDPKDIKELSVIKVRS